MTSQVLRLIEYLQLKLSLCSPICRWNKSPMALNWWIISFANHTCFLHENISQRYNIHKQLYDFNKNLTLILFKFFSDGDSSFQEKNTNAHLPVIHIRLTKSEPTTDVVASSLWKASSKDKCMMPVPYIRTPAKKWIPKAANRTPKARPLLTGNMLRKTSFCPWLDWYESHCPHMSDCYLMWLHSNFVIYHLL